MTEIKAHTKSEPTHCRMAWEDAKGSNHGAWFSMNNAANLHRFANQNSAQDNVKYSVEYGTPETP